MIAHVSSSLWTPLFQCSLIPSLPGDHWSRGNSIDFTNVHSRYDSLAKSRQDRFCEWVDGCEMWSVFLPQGRKTLDIFAVLPGRNMLWPIHKMDMVSILWMSYAYFSLALGEKLPSGSRITQTKCTGFVSGWLMLKAWQTVSFQWGLSWKTIWQRKVQRRIGPTSLIRSGCFASLDWEQNRLVCLKISRDKTARELFLLYQQPLDQCHPSWT